MAYELGHYDLHLKNEEKDPPLEDGEAFSDQIPPSPEVFFDGQGSPFCNTATIEHQANLYATELL
jgi:hypothetical protein